jgi:mRNA-degrading endonuclease toxin of MazEF toxin-antitoxin module
MKHNGFCLKLFNLRLGDPATKSGNLIEDAEPLRVRIKARDSLIQDSDAMVEQLRCVSKSRIGDCIGHLGNDELHKIETGVKQMLGLD